MSPKNMMWVSVITLIISLVTLFMVWQMQQNMAHSNADAALGDPVSETSLKANCESRGGKWQENLDSDGVSSYDCIGMTDPVTGKPQDRHYNDKFQRI